MGTVTPGKVVKEPRLQLASIRIKGIAHMGAWIWREMSGNGQHPGMTTKSRSVLYVAVRGTVIGTARVLYFAATLILRTATIVLVSEWYAILDLNEC
jgi:uncharacterized membrane protein